MRGKILRTGKQENREIIQVSTPCTDDHHFKDEELETVGELSQVCSQIVMKCFHSARMGSLQLTWQEPSPNGIKHVTNAWPD